MMRLFVIGIICCFILFGCSVNDVSQTFQPLAEEQKPETSEQFDSVDQAVISELLNTELPADIPGYRLLKFNSDPIISNEEDMLHKQLISLEELCSLAEEINKQGDFGYEIIPAPELPEELNSEPDKMSAIRITDRENNITAQVLYSNTYFVSKDFSFKTETGQVAAAEKMIWFARHLFGNLPEEAFPDVKEYLPFQTYIYVNGDIMYRYYFHADSDKRFDKNSNAISYRLSHSYNSVKQYKEYFSESTPVELAELSNHVLDRRCLKVIGNVRELQMVDKTGSYYNGYLSDDNNNVIPCKIRNIRTEDTFGDILNAKVFFGNMDSDYFFVDYYY